MTGQKGLAIAITALLLTVCVGYLFNAEQTTVDSLVYEERADLSPLIYENSSRVGGTEVYNSAVNVTGWTPQSAIPTTNNPNQYRFTESSINYSEDVTRSVTFENSGLTYTTVGSYSAGDWFQQTNDGSRYTNGLTAHNGQTIHGGRDYSTGTNHRYVLELNGVGVGNTNYLLWCNVTELYNFQNNDYLYLNTGATFYHDVEITATGNTNDLEGGAFLNLTGSIVSGAAYAIYNYATETWNAYDSQGGAVLVSASNLYIVSQSAPDQAFTFKYKQFTGITNAVYADPTKLVSSSALTWNFANKDNPLAGYSIIVKIDDSVNTTTLKFVRQVGNGSTAGSSFKAEIKVSSDHKIQFGFTPYIEDITNWRTVGTATAYEGLQLDIDCVAQTVTITGILSFDPNTPRMNYTLAPNNTTMNGFRTGYGYEQYAFTLRNDTAPVNAAVVQTVIYTDPAGVLWNDFNLNLSSYFPELINNADQGVRVQLGGFVTYGDSITINNRTFTVTDGKITVPLTDGLTVRNREMPLSGMAIDYTNDGKVNLIFTDNLNKVAELGDRVNYTIAGAGAWYFSSDINEIVQSHKQVWNWSTDWSLDANSTCLVYIGLLILGLVIGMYLGRGNLEIYDWVILALAGFIAFSLMVV